MSERWMNMKRARSVMALALFNFIFLGTEYLFDNRMAYVTDAAGVVTAQSYILGASAAGFLLFCVLNRLVNRKIAYGLIFVGSVICVMGTFVICQAVSYWTVLTSGLIVFVLLGIAGSAVHYYTSVALKKKERAGRDSWGCVCCSSSIIML